MSWTPERTAMLGTAPDAELAEKWDMKPNTVATHRIRQGIPPHQAQRKWTAEHVALLGRMTDAEVGAKTGRNTAAVTFKRRSLKIPGVVIVHPPK